MNQIEKIVAQTKNLRVLYAEDEPEVREETTLFLRKFFAHLRVTTNGSEAWEAFNQTSFDLLVTDLKMPVMNGNVLIDKIKQVAPDFKVIALTGLSSENGLPDKADVKLRKPIDLYRFADILVTLLELDV